MEALKQKGMKPTKETGSFINMMMSNNSTVPEVGKGATVLSWTDRHAYEVIEVSDDKKRVVVQQYNAKRIDGNGMSDSQEYEYKELNPKKEVIVWRWGAWRWERDKLLMKRIYSKINIVWGEKREYYDYTF